MASQKPLFIPWLKDQISSNNYPGLCWINEERTQFCIPWKHGLRHDLSENDSKIFEAWAKASGHYRPEVDKKDNSIWKRNFRCAMNKKKQLIRLIHDKSSESENPHKVFEFSDGLCNTSSVEADDEDNEGESPLSDLSQPASFHPFSGVNQVPLESYLGQMSMSEKVETNHMSLEYGNIQHMSPVLEISPSTLQPPMEALAASSVPKEPFQEVDTDSQWNEFRSSQIDRFGTEFKISVYYRGRNVKEDTVTNPAGFRIFFNHHETIAEHLDAFSLPDTSMLTDQLQILYINRLLEKVYQGLILEVQQNCIYARRLGRCKVYWSLSKHPTNQPAQEIGKVEPTMVYNFSSFISDLMAFLERRQGPPEYSFWLCFGEIWPDHENRPCEKMLIMVQVTLVSCQTLHEMAVMCGASSMQAENVNLQISDSLNSANLLSWLQELEERMETA
ncbi:interferon regulatory factor 3-like isoform X2 [Protopterus annectens]|uniref:interferon regulatory factor 3-like isoform X2 n=1 Tax=Protopterus annectens TaxID=7888 RepID=UPI001CFB1885|nr:interferon regulatory factor 3-like isoform X2 [Protopterus annectens]